MQFVSKTMVLRSIVTMDTTFFKIFRSHQAKNNHCVSDKVDKNKLIGRVVSFLVYYVIPSIGNIKYFNLVESTTVNNDDFLKGSDRLEICPKTAMRKSEDKQKVERKGSSLEGPNEDTNTATRR